MSIRIVTDSSCDLGIEFIKENNIELMPLLVNIDGEAIKDDLGQTLGYKEFYNNIIFYLQKTQQLLLLVHHELLKQYLYILLQHL